VYNTWSAKGIDLGVIAKKVITLMTPTKCAFVLEFFSLIEKSQEIGRWD
jgi:hypothetical protein